jgi:hypothetical protein
MTDTKASTSGDGWVGAERLNKAQMLLDSNKLLIAEIEANHDKRDALALQRNAVLIRQLNSNITLVVGEYKALAELVGGPHSMVPKK